MEVGGSSPSKREDGLVIITYDRQIPMPRAIYEAIDKVKNDGVDVLIRSEKDDVFVRGGL